MIGQLTGIRFFAAYLVLAHHFLRLEGAPFATAFLKNVGDVAVSLFFVLSGFVLTLSNKTPEGGMRSSRSRYLVARFARIYPQYLFAFVMTAPFAIAATFAEHGTAMQSVPRLAVNAVAYLSLLQSWVPWLANAWNGPAWSLSVEAFFYVAFIWLVPPRAARIWPWLLISAVAAILPVVVGAARSWPLPETTWLFFPPFRIGEFLLGMGIAQLYRQGSLPKFEGMVAELVFLASIVGLVTGLCLAEGVMVRVASTVFVPLALLALARATGPLTTALASKPMVLLGDASYGLYLLQLPVFSLSALVLGEEPRSPVQFLGYSACAVGISIVVHLYFEKPMAAAIKAWWSAREARVAIG